MKAATPTDTHEVSRTQAPGFPPCWSSRASVTRNSPWWQMCATWPGPREALRICGHAVTARQCFRLAVQRAAPPALQVQAACACSWDTAELVCTQQTCTLPQGSPIKTSSKSRGTTGLPSTLTVVAVTHLCTTKP